MDKIQELKDLNYQYLSDDLLLQELNKAAVTPRSLKGTDGYIASLETSGVNLIIEELQKRGITSNVTLKG